MSTDGSQREAWKGVFPSLPTPFDRDDAIDLEAMRRVVRFAIEAGSHGLICFGLAGEVFRLTPSERLALLEVIVDETGGAVPVLACVGTEATHTSCGLARAAVRLGADGIVVPPPVTGRPSRDELVHYFEVIASTAPVPVMIQDAPEYLKIELGPDLVADVASRCANVRFVKLEGGPDDLKRWVDRLGGRCDVFGGNGGMYLLDCLAAGAKGVAPGVDLVDLLVEIYELSVSHRANDAEMLFRRLLPALVFELQDIEHYNACAKVVLARRGVLTETHLRSPATALPPEGVDVLERYLEDLGVLPRDTTR